MTTDDKTLVDLQIGVPVSEVREAMKKDADERQARANERAKRIETLEAIIRLGIEMRRCQVRYFKTRSQADLAASKSAESAFDKNATSVLP